MKPAWDALANEFAGVYDVDCTAGGKSLCEAIGVQGYPTIKWGDPSDPKKLEDYKGGRDAAELREFAEKNLKPPCGPDQLDACSEEQKTMLEGFLKRPASELLAEAKKIESDAKAKQNKIDKRTAKLKTKKQDFEDDRDEQRGLTPKKGKEKEFEAKKAKMKERKEKIDAEEAAVLKETEALAAETENSGIKLMKLAAKANKGKTEL